MTRRNFLITGLLSGLLPKLFNTAEVERFFEPEYAIGTLSIYTGDQFEPIILHPPMQIKGGKSGRSKRSKS